uniref:translation initiation factor 2 n=1 Tax=Rhodella violacea TaxID=2801 RepID=UPI001FCDDDAE|nr:translation initiation factor 2 [Rhodella violacea]UNJ18123.1 translation initiation factor 2 [Rhodella violacea]
MLLFYNNNIFFFINHNNRTMDNILELQKPYILDQVTSGTIKSSSSSKVISGTDSNYNTTVQVVEKSNSKIDKKLKLKTDIDSEGKKIKLKSKKKYSSKFNLNDDDDDTYNILNNDDTDSNDNLSLSVMRPPRPNTKTNQKFSIVNKNKVKKTHLGSKQNIEENNQVLSEYQGPIVIRDSVTLQELAKTLNIAETDIIKFLFLKGICATINQVIDIETSKLIANNFDIDIVLEDKLNYQDLVTIDSAKENNLESRPPVVTIVGHIDHGKTTLIDKIRETNTVSQEAGGITQVMSSYSVEFVSDTKVNKITFIDTPGHEAFMGMRSRGVNVTDIVVLVVDSTDGIKPQTIESIELIKKQNLPVIVAINKIDKPDSNIDKIKEQLSKYELLAEDWGGETPMVPISALEGLNINKLLEMILLIAELGNLKANFSRNAQGTILEAYLDRSRGPVANLLVQNGTLKVGDIIVTENIYGKVRAIINDKGIKVKEAKPSEPVEIWGFSKVPGSGSIFSIYNSEQEAKLAIKQFNTVANISQQPSFVSLSNLKLLDQIEDRKQINLIIKTDVQGSVEAILKCLKTIPQNKVQLFILLISPGDITETDVELAITSKAMIIGFNTSVKSNVKNTIIQENIILKQFKVIYDLIEDMQEEMKKLLDPIFIEEKVGTAKVRTTFQVNKGVVAGCFVMQGKVTKDSIIKVRRDDDLLYDGKLTSLRKVKENVSEVLAENECGIFVEEFDRWRTDDVIAAYQLVETANEL